MMEERRKRKSWNSRIRKRREAREEEETEGNFKDDDDCKDRITDEIKWIPPSLILPQK